MNKNLKLITIKENKTEISKLNVNKTPGIDLIINKMLKELVQKGFAKLMYLLNTISRITYWPKSLKSAQIIMVPKPRNNPLML